MTDRDWREWAHLKKENWPEAIPEMGPKREHGPYPWREKTHDDPNDLDSYPNYHPDAASIGDVYMGDVCPYCGVPLNFYRDEVVTIEGDGGVFRELNVISEPIAAYHPECWNERRGETNADLDDY